MEFVIRMMGALVVTYVLSRVFIKLLGATQRRGSLYLVGANVLSFAVIALIVGLLRAYWSPFAPMAALPYVLPQILWLALDVARQKPYGIR
jgi:hypothetical protein